MSEIEKLDSVMKQKKTIHEKKLNYHRLVNKYKSMTWIEINEDFVNNHPSVYFETVQQLNVPFKVKLELMGKFFQQQLVLLQAQQHLSPAKVEIGSPLHVGTTVLDNITNNESTSSTAPVEITRSGRVSKKPTYYQEDTPDKFDDLKTKLARKPLTHEKKENSEKTIEPNKVKEPSKAVRSVLSKYEQKRNAIFDSILTDDNKTDINNSEDKTEKSESNENLNTSKTITIKRKHEDSIGIIDDLDDFKSKTPTPKKYKANRFFKSKNVENQSQLEDIIVCDISDSEETTLIDMPLNTSKSLISDQSSNVNEELDAIKRGRVSPPLMMGRKRNIRKKNPNVTKSTTQINCPICNQLFSKKDIDEHASQCTRYSSNKDGI